MSGRCDDPNPSNVCRIHTRGNDCLAGVKRLRRRVLRVKLLSQDLNQRERPTDRCVQGDDPLHPLGSRDHEPSIVNTVEGGHACLQPSSKYDRAQYGDGKRVLSLYLSLSWHKSSLFYCLNSTSYWLIPLCPQSPGEISWGAKTPSSSTSSPGAAPTPFPPGLSSVLIVWSSQRMGTPAPGLSLPYPTVLGPPLQARLRRFAERGDLRPNVFTKWGEGPSVSSRGNQPIARLRSTHPNGVLYFPRVNLDLKSIRSVWVNPTSYKVAVCHYPDRPLLSRQGRPNKETGNQEGSVRREYQQDLRSKFDSLGIILLFLHYQVTRFIVRKLMRTSMTKCAKETIKKEKETTYWSIRRNG